MASYCKRLFVALDILLNTLLFGLVEPISSRCGRQIVGGKPSRPCCILCKLLDLRWKNHCINNRKEPY